MYAAYGTFEIVVMAGASSLFLPGFISISFEIKLWLRKIRVISDDQPSASTKLSINRKMNRVLKETQTWSFGQTGANVPLIRTL